MTLLNGKVGVMLILFSSISIMRLRLQLAVSRLSVLIVSDMIL